MDLLELKKLSKDDFIKETNYPDLYDPLQNSKSGYITVDRIIPNDRRGCRGYTMAFGVGLSCHISNPSDWYTTSIITNIDWNKGEFTTLNSTYKFNFREDDKN